MHETIYNVSVEFAGNTFVFVAIAQTDKQADGRA